ncbi:MAG: hypothetical protein JNM30_10075 [Rhodospirillales bacterium]|nr:hypothetical protein [Rhodospirillales bacterium]
MTASHKDYPTELALFVPDITDVSTIKRSEAFLEHGFRLTVFGFRRQRYNRDYRPAYPFVPLGSTSDGRYLQRALALAAALVRLGRHRDTFRRASVFYARNIDQLLLALAARALGGSGARIVYEVLDIQPAFVARGFAGRAIRFVERLCLRRVALLVLSSPGFLRHFYRPVQAYDKPWFLLENKLPPSILACGSRGAALSEPAATPRFGYRWVVGYHGLIRGADTLDLIARLARRLRGQVLFRFRGILTTVDRRRFNDLLGSHPNIVYDGDYVNPRDLARIYGEIDFAWALDLENARENSRWLLPCRFYEAGFFGVPCLAARGFEIGELVEAHDVGWTFAAPFEDEMVDFLKRVTPAQHAERRQRLLALPQSRFVAGEDIEALCGLIDAGRHPVEAAAAPETVYG